MSFADIVLFIRAWVRNPRGVAAIMPSSGALASLMTREISTKTGPVIELGAGTGAFTQALLARGLRQEDLTLIEFNSDFALLLQTRFPDTRVLWMDALRLGCSRLFEGAPLGAVVCGLGFLNMPQGAVAEILKGAFGYLRPDGAFFLFTYGTRCSVSDATLAELDLEARCVGKTLWNVPPASVYRLSRRRTGGGL